MANQLESARLAFGDFELDADSGDLRKHGIRVKLHHREFQVLLALLGKPGQVVTRGELQRRLWPGDSFVEFDNGLNNAVSRLRVALADTSEKPQYIETVPRRGYRFLQQVHRGAPPSKSTSPYKRWPIVIIPIIGAALLLSIVLHFALRSSKAIHSLAVLPFRNLGTGTADEHFADGVTDAVTTELAKLSVPRVISETSVSQFRDTRESLPRIARALGVDAIVEGAVLREGNKIRITVQLISADTDYHLWADSYESQITDILVLQDEVALGVAHAIKHELSPGAQGGGRFTQEGQHGRL